MKPQGIAGTGVSREAVSLLRAAVMSPCVYPSKQKE
mgnify:CR=1 FL=1